MDQTKCPQNAGLDPERVRTQREHTHGVTVGCVESGRGHMLTVDMLHHSVILREQQVPHKCWHCWRQHTHTLNPVEVIAQMIHNDFGKGLGLP